MRMAMNSILFVARAGMRRLNCSVKPRFQRSSFTALLQSLGQASFEEIEAVMAEREASEPEKGLGPETMKRLQERVTGT